ncbi:sigma-70 family RNA polymerase sigma factor [Segetibacter sp. 3557_3]|uniref:RNA polymerase sigma factor n=1 Tax=Segetibacter sp. 3557_3 TaxID=2547429 RepID=UPI001058FD23|nr:sigma-70 family RNA polymerase sigma factor [Segetibacter sp. 3557_3]TDH27932.1 sigma-70 family RNA polymerase sigma factor [Segetibacter sp. 3557_3]
MVKDPLANITDKELLDRFYADNDNQWLGALLQRYTMLLLGVCMKYLKNEEDARDSVQQIFLKAITEVRKYRVDYFKSWLYMVAKNYCLMKIRDRHGRIPVELSANITGEPEDQLEQRAALLEKDHTLNTIAQSLDELSKEQKQCVTLFYLQKQSYQQIADTTGYNLLQVKSFIQNGKRNLKNIVEKKIKST